MPEKEKKFNSFYKKKKLMTSSISRRRKNCNEIKAASARSVVSNGKLIK